MHYETDRAAASGHMALLVDGVEVDTTPVAGMLPMALQHGGAGLRLAHDTGFPVSSRYSPPAPFSGTVHEVRIETPDAPQRNAAEEVRAALHAD